jgi:D-tyrosyl-tRNA(Tyr) deacylase
MIAVVQRVSEASVEVPSACHSEAIGAGLCVLLGIEAGDQESDARWMAGKLARLRIFRDDAGKMNRSVTDVGGEILLISQFTLAGDCAHGNRPSFTRAAPPELAERLYERVIELLRDEHRIPVKSGVFGGMMSVRLVNDGPVTLIMRSRENNPIDLPETMH